MYHRYYGLSRPPFGVTPDPSLLYMSAMHKEALAMIMYGVESRKGFMVCSGEVGMGKTTVLRAYFEQSNSEDTRIVYVFTPQIGVEETIRHIAEEIGIADPPSGFAGVQALQSRLLELYHAGKTVVLIVDEAQVLPPRTLEFLRLLSNFETDREKLIQIVLVGQPELDDLLARRDLRQVNDRVTLRATLKPFSFGESLKYIRHRLVATGAVSSRHVLSTAAARGIARGAGGIPRRINILADNVLIAGYAMEQRPVTGRLARATVREFLKRSQPSRAESRGIFGWLGRSRESYS